MGYRPGMFRGITDLIEVLAQLVPTPVLIGILVVAGLAAIPAWVRSVRTRQIKGCLRRAARAHDDTERHAELDAAFARAGDRPRLLVGLIEQAIRNGQPEAWRRGLDALAATGRAELDLARLRRKVEPPDDRVRDPLQAIVRVERHLRAGLVVAAEEALEEALADHPDDPDLRELAERVAVARAARRASAASDGPSTEAGAGRPR